MYIKITDVNKTIKKAPILRDINLEFTGGKVYGLRGKMKVTHQKVLIQII